MAGERMHAVFTAKWVFTTTAKPPCESFPVAEAPHQGILIRRSYTTLPESNFIKNKARLIRDIEQEDEDATENARKLKELSEKRESINEVNSQIPRWVFETARKGIEE